MPKGLAARVRGVGGRRSIFAGLALLLLGLACGGIGYAQGVAPGQIGLAGTWRLTMGAEGVRTVADLENAPFSSVILPASWQELGLEKGHGTIWLRREVLLPRDWQQRLAPHGWALLIDAAQNGGYEVYVSQHRIGAHGGPELPFPTPQKRLFQIPVDLVTADGRLVITLAIHKSPWLLDVPMRSVGPVGEEILLGDEETLAESLESFRLKDQRSRFPAAMLVGLLVAIAMYHLQFFYRRREARELFWFALMALGGACCILLHDYGDRLLPSFTWARRLEEFLKHGLVAVGIEFFWALVGRKIVPWLRGYQVFQLGIALFILVVPGLEWIARTHLLRQALLLTVLGAMAWLVWHEFTVRREYLPVLAAGLAVPTAAVVDVVGRLLGYEGGISFTVGAFAWLSIAMALSLSNRFSQMHQELDELRLQLEEKVEARTEELADTHRRLSSEVAERRLVEDALRMLERAVEQSIDGIAVTDPSGSTQFLNAAWADMHGHGVFDVLGYDLSLFHTPEQMQGEVYPLMAQVRERRAFQGEVGHRKKDGTVFPTWMSVTSLLDENSRPVGMLFIARDITERRRSAEEQLRLEARARQVDKLESLAVLASGIAHDFNNLLTGILGNTGLVLRELAPDAGERTMVYQVEAAAEKAANLSDQLLSYAGEDRLRLRPLSLNALVRESKGDLAEVIPEEATLQFQLRRGLPTAEIDPEQIKSVLFNLVKNAGESLADGRGVITVRSSQVQAERGYFEGAVVDDELPAGTYIFFEVSDSGRGVEESIRSRMFDPFFTTKGSGRGLGLASSLGIIRAHRGTVKVYSEPGRGSTIEVLLPAFKGQRDEVRQEPEVKDWRGGGTILVVDDEELVREVAQDILEQQGFEVLIASNGRQALEMFSARPAEIRVVLLDLTMPEMDGEEAFHALREIDGEAVILLMSGYSQQRARQRLEGKGLAGFLHKPFRPRDLLGKMREILALADGEEGVD